MTRESNLHRIIQRDCGHGDARLFRNNAGQAWQGDAVRLTNGDVLIKNAHPVRYGVCNPGGSDLLGWRSVVITPDMVGRRLAVFAALEVKTPEGRRKATEAQMIFLTAVIHAGGIAGVVKSSDEATTLLNTYPINPAT